MEAVPESVRMRPHSRHTLSRVAWNTVPEGEVATLDHFMSDYVLHLQHHLRQILGQDADDLIDLARAEVAAP